MSCKFLCRAALLTGMYPYHIGRQKGIIKPQQPTGLTLEKPTLAEELKLLGYRTHMVGKWHLGFCNLKFTPTHRGFDTFRGLYVGAGHYFNHRRLEGYDFWNGTEVDYDAKGNIYSSLMEDQGRFYPNVLQASIQQP